MIYLGKVVNTHGLKGEIRIISDFKYKEIIFKSGNIIYIDNKKYIINSYRFHKIFDMITLDGINNIDDALNLKGLEVYIDRNDYELGILNSDLIGLDVYDKDILKGKIIDVLKTDSYDLLVVDGKKRHMIPNIPEFVKNIDLNNNKIDIEYIKGLDNED